MRLGNLVGNTFSYAQLYLDKDIGVELEVEGLNLPKSSIGWAVHKELSLRGECGRTVSEGEDLPDTPREYVTASAVTLPELSTLLKSLHKSLTREKTTVRLTQRASTHFHVNMQPRTFREVFGFMLLYLIVEPVLLRLCGPTRNGNLFCVPCMDSGDLPVYLGHCAKALNSDLAYWPSDMSGNPRGKYSAMNIDPLRRLGTIEIRCFPNSIEPDEILKWGQWLLNIRDMAVGWPNPAYDDIFDYAMAYPSDIVGKIFTDVSLFQVLAPNNLSQTLEGGVETAYEAWRALLPVFHPPAKEKKKKQPPRENGWMTL